MDMVFLPPIERRDQGRCQRQGHKDGAGGKVGNTGLEGMIKAGLLGIQLLPRSALRGETAYM